MENQGNVPKVRCMIPEHGTLGFIKFAPCFTAPRASEKGHVNGSSSAPLIVVAKGRFPYGYSNL
jgi:hypothetical protein